MDISDERPKTYAVRHINENVRMASRSGGIFTALTDVVFNYGGIVYGCVLDEDFKAVHVRADNVEIRDKMRGSKYIQSEMGDTYRNVLQDLQTGRMVLFSGTPCQVAGFRHFLMTEYSNLICVDIVCHGVPSKKVWIKYLEWQQKRCGKKVIDVNFRDKVSFGWRAHKETLSMDDHTVVSSEIYRTLYYSHLTIRPCCYSCPYKSILHPGDISIADYWGISKAAPEFDDNKGVSLVLVNNELGDKVFDKCKNNLKFKETNIKDSLQQPLISPFPKPDNRDEFWHDFFSEDFGFIATKYGEYGLFNTIKKQLKGLKNKIERAVIK